LFKEIDNYISCIQIVKTPAVTARDGMEALKIAYLIRDTASKDPVSSDQAIEVRTIG
jgi:hypothetical protein